MSSEQKILDDNQKPKDRVVTDSVHARFRSPSVYCLTCRIEFDGNPASIEKHFNSSHTSTSYCCYCKGKVFSYRKSADNQGSETEAQQDFIYHKCQNIK